MNYIIKQKIISVTNEIYPKLLSTVKVLGFRKPKWPKLERELLSLDIHQARLLFRRLKMLINLLNKMGLTTEKNNPKNGDRKLINKALRMLLYRQIKERRFSGAPYVIHPIDVALSLIVELKITDPDVISAALLHDLVENTRSRTPYLHKIFGEGVCSIVEGLSNPELTKNILRTFKKDQRKWVKMKVYQAHVRELMDSEEVIMLKLLDIRVNVAYSLNELSKKPELQSYLANRWLPFVKEFSDEKRLYELLAVNVKYYPDLKSGLAKIAKKLREKTPEIEKHAKRWQKLEKMGLKKQVLKSLINDPAVNKYPPKILEIITDSLSKS